MAKLKPEQLQEAMNAYHLFEGRRDLAAEAIGLHPNTFANRINQAINAGLTPTEQAFTAREVTKARKVARPRAGNVKRFIVTAAQDSTKVHEPFFENLKTYAAYCEAELIVGAFTYNKGLFEDHAPRESYFPDCLQPFLEYGRINIADAVAVCCEMNTLPTAVRPLSGLQSYTGALHGVFPHAKVALETIAQPKALGAKFNYTTGAVTLPNYVPKKAGLKAEFHHIIGALIIEIDAKGRSWERQLIADKNGDFQDLDICVAGGKITTGNRVKAIAWGDIHHEKIDPTVEQASFFAPGNVLDTLRPEFQFFHDVADFRARNHHNIDDLHFLFERWCRSEDSVEVDIRGAADFLHLTRRDWAKSVVVESNHDLAFLKWLKRANAYAMDPTNALFFLRAQIAVFEAIAAGDTRFSIFEHTCRQMADLDGVEFLREDDSYMVDGTEFGMHSHLGINGARGSLASYARVGPKAMIGHGHGPGIMDGLYRMGVCQLEMGFNKGLSSWAVCHGLQYPNGKRALVMMQRGGAWRA